MEPTREALERAAARFGIELEYADTWGKTHVSSDAALRQALAALGVPAHDARELEDTLQAERLAEWSRPFPPCVVAWEDADSIRINIPAQRHTCPIRLEFEWEHGGGVRSEAPGLDAAERAGIAGQQFVGMRVSLPAGLPHGFHVLRAYWVDGPEPRLFGEARFIVCPRKVRTPQRRMAGVAISLYGLRSARNWGCGDFTDLRAMVDALAPAGVAFLALNPLHAIANRQPFNTSPYLPESSLYRNFLYLDVENTPGYEPGDAPREEIEALRASHFVEYERVARIKLAALRRAYGRFVKSGAAAPFDEYTAREGVHLEHYARYCALWQAAHECDSRVWLWTEWPEEYRDPQSPAVEEWAARHREEIGFYKFLQWQIDRQLAEAQAHAVSSGMAIGLYHDLALATDRFGADLWANRRFYVEGARVGAPPDDLAPAGQDWGFPPPHREAHRADSYELFAQWIRENGRHGGALRIDHVMRFFRQFWIPGGLSAAEGVYVRDYAEDLLGVLALESSRGGFIVIGEDLGTVPPGVRERLAEMGVLGYRVLWFEKNMDGSFRRPGEYPEHAAVTTTTHDLCTLAGYWLGRDIEARRAAGLVDEEGCERQWSARTAEIARLEEALVGAGFPSDSVGFLLSTPCLLAILNQEDLTGETEQQNLPASTWQYANWRRKMRVAVEDLGPIATELRSRLARAGRWWEIPR